MSDKIKELQKFAYEIRLTTLKALGNLGFGHVGGIMSMAEAMAVLYGYAMKIDPQNPKWEDRDFFVLSKGHCGPGVLATLALKGYFPEEEMLTVNQGGTRLPSHLDKNKTPGVDMSTGSLGQGISAAAGIALGNKMKNKDNYTYCIVGDGECDEGQVWESVLFAAQQKLDHLIVFVDYNRKQLDGFTEDICDLGDLTKKFADFNWFTQEVDGHDVTAIVDAVDKAKQHTGQPSMIVLNTVKGKGCTFAEDILYNHHMTFSKEDVEAAKEFIQCEIAGLSA